MKKHYVSDRHDEAPELGEHEHQPGLFVRSEDDTAARVTRYGTAVPIRRGRREWRTLTEPTRQGAAGCRKGCGKIRKSDYFLSGLPFPRLRSTGTGAGQELRRTSPAPAEEDRAEEDRAEEDRTAAGRKHAAVSPSW
jgi:hypothetical protein